MIELENERRYLNQWALNQRVEINNFLPGTYVEFSSLNDCKNTALVTEAYVEAGRVFANIPNVLLQTYGYLHVYVNPAPEDTMHTPEERDIKVVRREKPAHYIYTETPTVSFKSKADTFWGVENAGKTLVIGADGYLTIGTASSGGGEGSGDGNIATDDEVNDMFDDVFDQNQGSGNEGSGGNENTGDDNVNGEIATDEEVNDMFNDVFG